MKTHFIGMKTHFIGRKTHLIGRKTLIPLQLIPPKMMTDLYTTCGAPVKRLARSVGKQFHIIWCIIADLSKIWNITKHLDRFPAGSHNETWACSDYYQTITYFLDEVERRTEKNRQWLILLTAPQVLYLNRESGRARAASPSTLVTHSNVLNV